MERSSVTMEYDDNNPFALILQGKVPASKMFENEHVLVFKDIYPKAKTHLLIIPKAKYTCYADFMQRASNQEILDFFQSIKSAADTLKISHYTLITNNGKHAGQIVFHFHVHLLSESHVPDLRAAL